MATLPVSSTAARLSAMSSFFPRNTVEWRLEEPAAFRRLSLSLVEMALLAGIVLRVLRALTLHARSRELDLLRGRLPGGDAHPPRDGDGAPRELADPILDSGALRCSRWSRRSARWPRASLLIAHASRARGRRARGVSRLAEHGVARAAAERAHDLPVGTAARRSDRLHPPQRDGTGRGERSRWIRANRSSRAPRSEKVPLGHLLCIAGYISCDNITVIEQ